MPDMDTPKIAGMLEEQQGSLTTAQAPSKRPRDEGSPVCGKRGKKKTDAFAPPAPLGDGDRTPAPMSPPSNQVSQVLDYNAVVSPPLCESPSKINQAPSSFAPFSGGEATSKPGAGAAPAAAAATATTVTKRKGRVPHAAPPSVGATDPIFHAALLRLLHSRNGEHCPEAVGWRWRGDSPARFDHWPCALHPVVMDLLACVSAGEERVVMTGCDKRHAGSGGSCGGSDDNNTPPPREAAWRAPLPRLPRTPSSHRGTTPAVVPATPAATTPLRHPARTPSSALRRPGSSCRLSSKNRVRFSTHDMSVVDTPDPQRGGSEEGMVSALGGLESILSAAERVRDLAARGSSTAALAGQGRRRHYEGYYDRFSAAGGQAGGSNGGDGAVAAGEQQEAAEPLASTVSDSAVQAPGAGGAGVSRPAAGAGDGDGDGDGGEAAEGSSAKEGATTAAVVAPEKDDAAGADVDVDAYLTTEAKSVREDSAALVAVLEQIASSDSAPDEVALVGGWGPEHSNAAAFYAKELALLCGATAGDAAADAVTPAAGMGAGFGSHLRGRYLDVLSCLVRYNLKLLLNTCECELPEEEDAMEEDHDQDYDEKDDNDGEGEGEGEVSDDDENPTSNLPSPPSSPPTAPSAEAAAASASASAALTVIVPGRAALLREHGRLDASWGSSVTSPPEGGFCGCVSVLDDKGALEFNSEDVAALLTLALGRVHPFMPLVARITVAAGEGGWSGGAAAAVRDGEGGDDSGDDSDDDTLDARVWAAVQQYTLECRAAAAAAASSSAAGAAPVASSAAATPASLFASPVSAGALPAPPAPCISAEKPDGPGPAGKSSAASSGADDPEEKRKGGGDEAAAMGGEADGGGSGQTVGSPPAPASPSDTLRPGENGSTATTAAAAVVGEVEFTVDEAADLLEFVAAARFIAQLIAEPVVSAGISAGRWSSAMRLADQVRKLAEEEQEAQRFAFVSGLAAEAAAKASSLSNMLCLGALADVQDLGLTMAQQARYAPALEAALKKELRQAMRRGHGLKRRIRHRLQQGAPDVFSFPMVVPACQLVHHGGFSHDSE